MTGDVTEKIRELGGGTLSFVKKELQRLPELLKEGEELRALGAGEINGKNWLLAVTDARLMLLYVNSIGEEFVDSPLEEIRSVACTVGVAFFTATIAVGEQKYIIKKLERTRFKDIVAAFPKNVVTVKKQNIFIRLVKIAFGILFLLFIFGLLVDKDIIPLPEKTPKNARPAATASSQSTQPSQKTAPAVNPTEGITLSAEETVTPLFLPFSMRDVIEAYNATARKLGIQQAEKRPFGKKKGVQHVFQHHLNEYAVMTFICAQDDQTLNGVLINASGDGSERSGKMLVLTLANIFHAMTPDMPGNERSMALKQLGIIDGALADGRKREDLWEGLHFTTSRNEHIGILMSVDPT